MDKCYQNLSSFPIDTDLSNRKVYEKPYTIFEPFLSPCNVTVIPLARASPTSSVGVLFPVKALKLTAYHPLCEVSKTRTSALGQSVIKEWRPTLPLRQTVSCEKRAIGKPSRSFRLRSTFFLF